MATAAQIRTAVDNRLATFWTALGNYQDAFYITNHRYAQFLRSASVIPADGNAALPDVGDAQPVGTRVSWPANWINTPIEGQLEVHEYVCPDGTAGYVAFARVTINGNTWERAQAVGPEAAARTHGWAQMADARAQP